MKKPKYKWHVSSRKTPNFPGTHYYRERTDTEDTMLQKAVTQDPGEEDHDHTTRMCSALLSNTFYLPTAAHDQKQMKRSLQALTAEVKNNDAAHTAMLKRILEEVKKPRTGVVGIAAGGPDETPEEGRQRVEFPIADHVRPTSYRSRSDI